MLEGFGVRGYGVRMLGAPTPSSEPPKPPCRARHRTPQEPKLRVPSPLPSPLNPKALVEKLSEGTDAPRAGDAGPREVQVLLLDVEF